jgi:hypothetical protein
MPIDDSLEGPLERWAVDRTGNLGDGADVVQSAVGLQLIQKPEPLLGKR